MKVHNQGFSVSPDSSAVAAFAADESRPNITYVQLITDAIKSSHDRKLILSDIQRLLYIKTIIFLLNNTLGRRETFPTVGNIADVKTRFFNGKKNTTGNYRPVSLTFTGFYRSVFFLIVGVVT